MTFMLGIALAPFLTLLLVALFAAPVRIYLQRRLPRGWLRRILLFSWRV